MDTKNQSKSVEEGIMGEKSILNVEAQKEIIDYSAKVRTRYALKTLFIVLPAVGIFVCVLLYVIYKFLGII